MTDSPEQDYQDHIQNVVDHDAELEEANEIWEQQYFEECERIDKQLKINNHEYRRD